MRFRQNVSDVWYRTRLLPEETELKLRLEDLPARDLSKSALVTDGKFTFLREEERAHEERLRLREFMNSQPRLP